LIIILLSCNHKTEIKEVVFDFYPSFYHPTHITIDYTKKLLNVNVFEDYYIEDIEYSDTTEPYIIENSDTLITFYNKTFAIKDDDLEKFVKAEDKSDFNSTITHKRSTLDGISFRATKININNDTIYLNSVSPIRENKFKLDYSLLDPLFNLLYSTINDNHGITVVEEIQRYFDYRLIRKVNENPLEIRIYGGINNGCTSDNHFLASFLDSLPNEVIIFDCREGQISYCAYPLFEKLAKSRTIYFYGKNEISKCDKDTQNALDEDNQFNNQLKYKNEAWKKLERKATSKYNKWLNNPNIQWFETKEEIITHIANH